VRTLTATKRGTEKERKGRAIVKSPATPAPTPITVYRRRGGRKVERQGEEVNETMKMVTRRRKWERKDGGEE